MAKIHVGEDARPQKQRVLLPPMNNVVANSTAYLDLPLGYRYHNLSLAYGGTTFDYTLMSAIRLYANNELFQTISGADRNAINQYLGLAAGATGGAGILILPFERMGILDFIERYKTCINTGVKSRNGGQSRKGIESFRIEVDIGAATAPTLALYADVSDVNIEQSTLMPRIDSWLEPVVAGTEYLHVNTPRKLLRDPLRPFANRLWMKDTIAHITAFRATEDGQEVLNRTTTLNEAVQKSWKQRTPQAGYVAIDPEEHGEPQGVFSGMQAATFDFRSTHAAGATTPLTMLLESMGPLGG